MARAALHCRIVDRGEALSLAEVAWWTRQTVVTTGLWLVLAGRALCGRFIIASHSVCYRLCAEFAIETRWALSRLNGTLRTERTNRASQALFLSLVWIVSASITGNLLVRTLYAVMAFIASVTICAIFWAVNCRTNGLPLALIVAVEAGGAFASALGIGETCGLAIVAIVAGQAV